MSHAAFLQFQYCIAHVLDIGYIFGNLYGCNNFTVHFYRHCAVDSGYLLTVHIEICLLFIYRCLIEFQSSVKSTLALGNEGKCFPERLAQHIFYAYFLQLCHFFIVHYAFTAAVHNMHSFSHYFRSSLQYCLIVLCPQFALLHFRISSCDILMFQLNCTTSGPPVQIFLHWWRGCRLSAGVDEVWTLAGCGGCRGMRSERLV